MFIHPSLPDYMIVNCSILGYFQRVVGSEIHGPSVNDFHHLNNLLYKVFELARPLDV